MNESISGALTKVHCLLDGYLRVAVDARAEAQLGTSIINQLVLA